MKPKPNRILAHLILWIAFLCDAINPLRVRARQALANTLVNRTVILGVKTLAFARDGVGGVSSSSKPANADALYISLGRVEKGEIMPKSEDIVIRNASSGTYGEEFSIPMGKELSLSFTMQNINQILMEALYLASGAITVATPLQPMEQPASIKGWLEVERYDHTGTSTISEHVWCELSVPKMDTAEKSYSLELIVDVLKNTSNTLNIVALAAL